MNTIKVCSWNVENLFRNGSNGGPKTSELYRKKLESLALVLEHINADVVGLQEVGETGALEDLLDVCKVHYPHYRLSDFPDPRGIRVGFISKLPIQNPQNFQLFPADGIPKLSITKHDNSVSDSTRFGRGVMIIEVEIGNGWTVQIMNAHLKSKLLTFTNSRGGVSFTPKDERERAQEAARALIRRTGEATGLRVLANQILENNNHNPLIVLGDMNDGPDAATTQIILGPGGSQISERDKEAKVTSFDRADKGDDTRLFNLANLIPAARRYSRIYNQTPELIDHIFASVEMFPTDTDGKNRRLPDVDSIVDLYPIENITDNPNLREGKPGSDHAPIVASFNLG